MVALASVMGWRQRLDLAMYEAAVGSTAAEPAADLAVDGGGPEMALASRRKAHPAGEGLPEIRARLDQAGSTAVPPLTLAPSEAVGASVQVAA